MQRKMHIVRLIHETNIYAAETGLEKNGMHGNQNTGSQNWRDDEDEKMNNVIKSKWIFTYFFFPGKKTISFRDSKCTAQNTVWQNI